MRFGIAGLCLAAMVAACTPALAQDDLSDYQQPGINLPDPVANNGVHFAPGIATAGTANAGATLASVTTDNKGCSAINPCAMTNPALDNLAPARRQASRAGKSNSSS